MADEMTAGAGRDLKVWFCTGCGNCCRWPGDVRVLDDEVESIAAHLGLEVEAFVERYTRLHSDRKSLSLVDRQTDTGCVFLTEDDRCAIQSVKPRQCRDFPNRWHDSDFEQDCAALAIRTRLRRAPANTPTTYPSSE